MTKIIIKNSIFALNNLTINIALRKVDICQSISGLSFFKAKLTNFRAIVAYC